MFAVPALPGLAELAVAQHGVVSRRQLAGLGLSGHEVKAQLAARRWQPRGRRVVVLHNGELTLEQKEWSAVLEGGPDCVLTGLSSLQRHGLAGFPPERVHCVVPLGGLSRRDEDIIQRQSRRLDAGSVHPARRPPMTRVPDALVDALEVMDSQRKGCGLIAAVVQQRLLRPHELLPLMQREPTLPGRRVYRSAAADIGGGAQSLLEIDFLAIARRARVRAPRQQTVRMDRQGRRRYLDADFDTFSVEVDGAFHLRALQSWLDQHRQNALVLTGRPLLRFPSVAIYLDEPSVREQLRAAVARWG